MFREKRTNRVGILFDEDYCSHASDMEAIHNFCDAFLNIGIEPLIIGAGDLELVNPDIINSGLLIRDTTRKNNHTMGFALRATAHHLPVIDSPYAIMLGCNKISQTTSFRLYNVPHPETILITYTSYQNCADIVSYPIVIKIPDAAFSKGTFLAHTQEEYFKLCERLLQKHPKLLAQRFIPTEFDWRICLFEKKILFACKYYMVDEYWKVIKYPSGNSDICLYGKHECFPTEDLPYQILDIVEKCSIFLDDGLYGLDIKQTKDNQFLVIEINDNPSIDSGVEDDLLGFEIYEKIASFFI